MLDAPIAALPPVRDGLSAACADYDATGVAILSGAFAPEDLAEAKDVLVRLAASERQEGCALMQPGGNQRLYGLVQKAPVFRRLVASPGLLALMHHILGPQMLLYSLQAHIVPRGGNMDPHFDQLEFLPHVPQVVLAAAILALDDFGEANGATCIAAGSIAVDGTTPGPAPEKMAPLEMKIGSLAAVGGLTWHSTGINRTDTPRHGILFHFCLPWVRQHENYQRTISTAVARDMTEQMRDLLGIHEGLYGRRWHSSAPEHRPRLYPFDIGY